MSSLLQNLSSNETVLLMYLANELPADDRAEVEAMLSSDLQFGLPLAQLRQYFDTANVSIALDDARSPIPSSFAAARAFGDHVRKARATQRTIDDTGPARRSRWMLYPTAAAAMLTVGMLLWWGTTRDEWSAMPPPEIAAIPDLHLIDDTEVATTSLIANPVYAGPMDKLNDDQLLAMFEPVMQPAVIDAQYDYTALSYINETLQ